MRYFYSTLVNLEPLFVKLEEIGFEDDQRAHLAVLIDSTIHHTILDLVLSSLEKEDKIVFVEMLRTGSEHEELMEFLTVKIEDIEGKIIETVERVQMEFIQDVEEVRTLK